MISAVAQLSIEDTATLPLIERFKPPMSAAAEMIDAPLDEGGVGVGCVGLVFGFALVILGSASIGPASWVGRQRTNLSQGQ